MAGNRRSRKAGCGEPESKEQGAAVSRLQQLVSCLDEREDAKAEAFLLKCFENAKAFEAIKSEPAGSDLKFDQSV